MNENLMAAEVNPFPRCTAVFTPDGTVNVSVVGVEQTCEGADARDQALRHFLKAALRFGRPVLVLTTAVDGSEVKMIVTPAGQFYTGEGVLLGDVPAAPAPAAQSEPESSSPDPEVLAVVEAPRETAPLVSEPAPLAVGAWSRDDELAAPAVGDAHASGEATSVAPGLATVTAAVPAAVEVDGPDLTREFAGSDDETPGGDRRLRRAGLCVVAALVLLLVAVGAVTRPWAASKEEAASEPAHTPAAAPVTSPQAVVATPAPAKREPSAAAVGGRGFVKVRVVETRKGDRVTYVVRAGKKQRKHTVVAAGSKVSWTAPGLSPGVATWSVRVAGTVVGAGRVRVTGAPKAPTRPPAVSSGGGESSGSTSWPTPPSSTSPGTTNPPSGQGGSRGGRKPRDTPDGPKAPTTRGPGAPAVPVPGRVTVPRDQR